MRYIFLLAGFLICSGISEAADPVVGSITLFNDDNGGTTTPTTQMSPNDEMTLVVEVSDGDGFNDIYGVNFYIWDSTTTTKDGTNTPTDYAIYQWSNTLGWRLVGPLSSTWTIDKVNCAVGTITPSTGTLKLVFTPGKISRYEQDKNWRISINVQSSIQSKDGDGQIEISNAFYSEIGIDNKEGSFTSNPAGINDNPITSPINANIISNATFTFQIKAEDFIGEGGTISDSLSYTLTNTITSQTTITTTYQPIGTYSITLEEGATKTIYLWLDYPEGLRSGTYNSQLYLKVSPIGTTTGIEITATLQAYIKPQLGYLVFKTAPTAGIAGENIPFIIQRKDTFNTIMIDGITTINLSGMGTFSPSNTLIINDGTSTVGFHYYQEKIGSYTITAYCGTVTIGATILINPTKTDHLAFLIVPATITISNISPIFKVERQDKFNNPVTQGTLSITGYSNSTGAKKFLPVEGESISIRDGVSTGEFYYYDESPGSRTIRVGAFGINEISPAWANTQIILPPPYVKFVAENIPTESQFPGNTNRTILKIFVENFYPYTKTITSLKLTNATKGSGSQTNLDDEISNFYLNYNSLLLGSATFFSGVGSFTNLHISISPWGTTTFLITYDLSLKNAKDGDIIEIQLEDVTFATSTTINGNFPLNSYGHHIVDGMVASQKSINHILPNNFKSGELNNLVLDIIIPSNGYAEDILRSLSIENAGNANENDIVLKLWVGTDICLGTMNFTGAMWQKTGLNQPIGTTGLNVFIKADIKDTAYEGKTIKLRVPIGGIEVSSNNDGPIDEYIENYYSQQIKVHNKVIFEALDLLKEKVYPKDKEKEILSLAVTNYYPENTQTLTSIIITNTSKGSGTITQLDSQVNTLYLYDGTTTIGISNYKNGKAIFAGLNLAIAPGETKKLKVKYDVALHNAKDDNIIDCHIAASMDISFESGTISIGGIFPLDSSGFHKIDGLVNTQITNYGAKATTIATGTTNVLVLDVLIPSNGYAEDTLTRMRIKNSGTAKDSRDIKMVKLCIDSNTYTTTWKQEYWEWEGTISILYPGKRIFVMVDIADNPGNTIMMKIPVNGLEFLSDNDGPIDSEVINPYIQTISTGLLSSLKLTSPKVEVGGTTTIIMEVKNSSTEDIHTVTPIMEGSAILITAPLSILPAGSWTEFRWTYQASDYPGTLTFRGYATSTTLSSIPTYSEILYIQNIPKKLVVSHIPSMPFEVNRGQQDIIPMSIIFKNPATASLTGDISIGTLTFEVGTIPNLAIAKITLMQAGIVYGSKTNIEDSGTTIILPLKIPIVIHSNQSIAVSLIIEIPTSTTIDRFQISLTSVDLDIKIEGVFPLNSGYAWIKAPSEEITVGLKNDNVPEYVNKGQSDVLATQIEFIGNLNTSKVEITRLSITINSTNTISKLIIKDDTITYAQKDITTQNPIDIDLWTPIIIYDFKKIDVRINIADEPLTSIFNVGSLSVDARDYNTKEALEVVIGTTSSKLITIQSKAQQAIVTGTSTIPAKVYLGQEGIKAFELTINNPGTTNSASILLKEVTLNIPQGITVIIGDCLGTSSGSGTQTLTLITPAIITPQTSITLNFKIDISAKLGEFKLDLLDVQFVDANNLNTITDTFSSISALSQIKAKPTGLVVSYQNQMPVNVSMGDKHITALALTFTNQGGTDTDEITIGTITLTTLDRFNNPIVPASILSKLTLCYDGTQTSKNNIETTGSKIIIKLVPPLKISVDKSKDMEINVDISSIATADNFKISLMDVSATDNWDNSVNISGTFPMQSESTMIFKSALETSFTNYPNPFAAGRESTTIAYYLPQDGYVTIKIYTVIGDLVITLLQDSFKSKGMHQEDRWDGRNGVNEIVLNGIYFCQIKVNYIIGGSDKKIRKIAVIR